MHGTKETQEQFGGIAFDQELCYMNVLFTRLMIAQQQYCMEDKFETRYL